MADGGEFQKLHEKASQTGASLTNERTGETVSEQQHPTLFTETLSSITPLSTQPKPPDDTIPKLVASERPNQDEGQDHGQPREGVGTDAEVNLRNHQCAHQDGVIAEDEEDVHRAKHPESELLAQAHGGTDAVEESYLREASHALSINGSDVTDSYKRSYSSSFSSITNCDVCSAANASIRCAVSKEFWEGVEGTKCCERIWNHVLTRLNIMFPNDDARCSKRVMVFLKKLLGVKDDLDPVHISKYLRLVTTFGPFRIEDNKCVVLKQIEDLVKGSSISDKKTKRKISWFAGPMSCTDAEAKLEGKTEGTFLIRMSESEQGSGSFVASLVMADGITEHFLLQGHPEDAVHSVPFSLCLEFRDKRFSSLPELVNGYLRKEEVCVEGCDNATRCRVVCADLPFNHVINGYAK